MGPPVSVYLLGLLWVGGATVAAAVVARFAHGRLGLSHSDNPPISAVLTLIGGLQAVLMMFVLIALFDAGSTVREGASREADALVSLSWSANSLPEPERTRIQSLVRDYAATVVDAEWPRMSTGEPVADGGWARLAGVQRALEEARPADGWEEERRLDAAEKSWVVYEARQDRLDAAAGGVNAVVWFALAAGGLATILLTYLFEGLPRIGYLVTVSMVAGTVALVLFVIYQLQNPYGGGAGIGPDVFRAALTRLA